MRTDRHMSFVVYERRLMACVHGRLSARGLTAVRGNVWYDSYPTRYGTFRARYIPERGARPRASVQRDRTPQWKNKVDTRAYLVKLEWVGRVNVRWLFCRYCQSMLLIADDTTKGSRMTRWCYGDVMWWPWRVIEWRDVTVCTQIIGNFCKVDT